MPVTYRIDSTGKKIPYFTGKTLKPSDFISKEAGNVLEAKSDGLYIPEVTGPAGKSSYQVWLDAGNSGTVQQYIDSLKGIKGDKGDPAKIVIKEDKESAKAYSLLNEDVLVLWGKEEPEEEPE